MKHPVTGRRLTWSWGVDFFHNYFSTINELKKYRSHMGVAEQKRRGDPTGSGITDAGCKITLNQRLKQSAMRWHRKSGQCIVGRRTASRSGI